MENLQSDLMIALKWLKDNEMMANPEKFQYMILSKNAINKSIAINNKTNESSKSLKLLGLTIDNKLNYGIHINNVCKVASAKIKCLDWIELDWNAVDKIVEKIKLTKCIIQVLAHILICLFKVSVKNNTDNNDNSNNK